MWCAHSGVSGCGETVRGSNVRRNETETERKERLVLVSVVGGRVCCNLDMNPNEMWASDTFPSCCCHSYEQLSALTRHLLKASGSPRCPVWGLVKSVPAGQVLCSHVCCDELRPNEDYSSPYGLHRYLRCPAGALNPHRCNIRAAQGMNVDILWRPGPLW